MSYIVSNEGENIIISHKKDLVIKIEKEKDIYLLCIFDNKWNFIKKISIAKEKFDKFPSSEQVIFYLKKNGINKYTDLHIIIMETKVTDWEE